MRQSHRLVWLLLCISILTAIQIFSGCAPSTLATSPTSPCVDSIAQIYRAKPQASLTEREWQYLQQKDHECQEARNADAIAQSTKDLNTTIGWFVTISVLGAVLAAALASR